MQNNQAELLTKMFEYNLWANIQLIDICSQLTADQLSVEVEGVYGQIQPTLAHLVRAEGGYAKRLSGSPLWADDLDWDAMSLADLSAKATISGKKLVEIAGIIDPNIRHQVELEDGTPFPFFNWTSALQALYHGIEHRTQIKVLLTKLNIHHPNLAAWDFVESLLAE